MSENIVPSGETEFHQRIEQARDIDAEGLVRFLIEALDRGYSRDPLAQLITRGMERETFGSSGLHVFLAWRSQVYLVKADDGAETNDPRSEIPDEPKEMADDVPDWSNDLDDYIAETVVNAFSLLRERTETLQAYGNTHKYWFFRPGWQVESALWDQIFEEHDPALTIGFYLSAMFKDEDRAESMVKDGSQEEASSAARQEPIELTYMDQSIIRSILEIYAEVLARPSWNSRRTPAKDVLLRCLITAARLDHVLDGGLSWEDPDFCEAVSNAPPSISSLLLQYWAGIDFYKSHNSSHLYCEVDYSKDGVLELVNDQADYVSACVLAYLGSTAAEYDPEPPEDFEFDDATLLKILENFTDIDRAGGRIKLFREVVAAVYRARQSVFGGVYPFTFTEAEQYFSKLRRGGDFWLSHVVQYGPENDQDDSHPFWVFAPGQQTQGRHTALDVRTNRHAVGRFQAYKQALDSIRADGLDELAGAWWAFFIASQTMAFRGLRLPADQISHTVQIAASLLPDHAIKRALQFALELSQKMASPLEARVTKAAIDRHLAKDQRTSPETENIVVISARSHQVERFLSDRIGPSVWMQLEQQTRADLVQAEQLFSMSYQDLGAGRSDWGPLVTLYARTVEAEAKRRLMPIIETAEAIGACKPPKALTLGGCKNMTTVILQWLVKNPQGQLSVECIQKLRLLDQLFAEHSFLVETRNRATHADRANPVEASALLMWREAMFHKGLFAAILA